jgi:hypothetical protein
MFELTSELRLGLIPKSSAFWTEAYPCRICMSIAGAIETCAPASATHFQYLFVTCEKMPKRDVGSQEFPQRIQRRSAAPEVDSDRK